MQNILKSAMKVPVICGLLLLVLVDMGQAACDHDSSIDGCSFPADLLTPFYKEFFREACNRHDVCYGCGSGRSIDRSACDSAFLRDMNQICDSSDRPICRTVASGYYDTVRLLGGTRYHDRPLSYCNAAWVSQCLP